MFKLLLRHMILDFALNMMFDKIKENIHVKPMSQLLGKLVVIKITEECRKLQGFSSQYCWCIISHIMSHGDGSYMIKCILDPFARHTSTISQTAYFESSDILHIREPLKDD